MKPIQFTVYEVAGYMFPGIFATVGLSVAYASAFTNRDATLFLDSPIWWLSFAFASYILGHITQAVANYVASEKSTISAAFSSGDASASSGEIRSAAAALARRLYGVSKATKLSDRDTIAACDILLQQRGNEAMREVFIYREGFYRGLWISFFLLGVCILPRLACSRSALIYGITTIQFSKLECVVLILTAFLFSFLCYSRYLRFRRLHARNAVISALVISNSIEIELKSAKNIQPEDADE